MANYWSDELTMRAMDGLSVEQIVNYLARRALREQEAAKEE